MPRSSKLADTFARNLQSNHRATRRAKSHSRATVENLERRQLLSAAISGIVLQDVTGNGLTSDDHALKGQVVKLYHDTNGNGILDSNETKVIASKTSKANGSFCFNNLKAGNYLIADFPVKSIRTAPVLSNTYAVQVTSGNSGGYVFDNYVNTFKPKLLSGITYTIDGTKTVSTLTNNVQEGDTVTVNFTVAKNSSVTLSLVSYHAPSATFDPTTANQQVVAGSSTMTFGPGAHSMTVTVPDCYFQIDFVGGTVITQFGPAGSNIFYQQEGRLISNANGGDHSCGCDCTPNTPQPSSISGLIYCDTNLNGSYDAGVDEAMAGQTVDLTGTTTTGTAVTLTTTTANDGTFQFTNLAAGTYTISEPEPGGHVDAKNFALVAAGNGAAAQNGTTDTISGITLAAGQNLGGYQFAEVEPGPISGTVWVDFNNDGVIDASEPRLAGVQIALAGTNDLGQTVAMTTMTDALGNYVFNVRPGIYSLTETQPAGFLEGKDILGSLGGDASVQDNFSHISLPGCDGAGAGYNFGKQADPASLSGRVFCDSDLSGTYNAGDDALAGVSVVLTGTTLSGQNVNVSTTTAADGTYSFTNLSAGTYKIVEAEPAGHVDGKNFAAIGTAGGTRSQASAAGPDTVAGITLTGQNATGYDFAEVSLGSISGTVWLDCNNDGKINNGENGIANVKIMLTGTDDLGNSVTTTTTTDCNGNYCFTSLRPGTYTITETQPANILEGKDVLGSLGGNASVQDIFSNVQLPGCDGCGTGYDFGEQVQPSCGLSKGCCATIGFWNNKNGQALINCVNSGANCTQLGNWLAATCPNLYSCFKGKTNSYIASCFSNDFNHTGQKLNAQVLGCALAVYVTDTSLCGNVAASYGFKVGSCGTSCATINVGSCGSAFGCGNNSTITVFQALCAADAHSQGGTLYGGNTNLCDLANTIFAAINQTGDIA